MITLYKRNTSGGIEIWKGWITDQPYHGYYFEHGKIEGKLQRKFYRSQGVYLGKSNEISPRNYAPIILERKVKALKEKGYRETIEEAMEVEDLFPMLAHNYTKSSHHITYPCCVSPKLDGVRSMFFCTPESITCISRAGKSLGRNFKFIMDQVKALYVASGKEKLTLDGEFYVHGKTSTDIGPMLAGTVDNSNLKYYIFDVPSEKKWIDRYADLVSLASLDECANLPALRFVESLVAASEAEAYDALHHYISNGFEGLMLRNNEGLYTYALRSYDLQKWKIMQDDEAWVVSVTPDKIGEGILMCKTKWGTFFECKMKGNHEFRSYENMQTLVGQWINYKYQHLSRDSIPVFPVGMYVRPCDERGNPLE